MTNHPNYQGNSGIPLAVGVDLKNEQVNKNLTFKTKNKTQGVHWFLSCSNGTQMSAPRPVVCPQLRPRR